MVHVLDRCRLVWQVISTQSPDLTKAVFCGNSRTVQTGPVERITQLRHLQFSAETAVCRLRAADSVYHKEQSAA